jgi:hypothetical protein
MAAFPPLALASSLSVSMNDMISNGAVAKTLSVDTQSRPFKRKRSAKSDAIKRLIVVADDGSAIDEPPFPASQATQSAYQRLVQGRWIKDDYINVLLATCNPNVSFWHIASTHLLNISEYKSTLPPKFKDLDGLPRILLSLVHLVNVVHWTLATSDHAERRCASFDAHSSMLAPQLT